MPAFSDESCANALDLKDEVDGMKPNLPEVSACDRLRSVALQVTRTRIDLRLRILARSRFAASRFILDSLDLRSHILDHWRRSMS